MRFRVINVIATLGLFFFLVSVALLGMILLSHPAADSTPQMIMTAQFYAFSMLFGSFAVALLSAVVKVLIAIEENTRAR